MTVLIVLHNTLVMERLVVFQFVILLAKMEDCVQNPMFASVVMDTLGTLVMKLSAQLLLLSSLFGCVSALSYSISL
jgi:hypothetical protein